MWFTQGPIDAIERQLCSRTLCKSHDGSAKFSVSVMVDNEEQIFAKNGADLVERPDFSPTSLSAPSAIQFYRAIRCSGRYPTNFEIRLFRVIGDVSENGK